MGIGPRIKEARERAGLTQKELGKLVGVTGSAITNYENDISHPKEPVMYALIEALGVDANYLFQDVVNLPTDKNDITLVEYDHIKKYRALDEHGKTMVDMVLDEETARMAAAQEAEEAAKRPATKIIPLFGNSFAAGIGEPDFGNALEEYEIPFDTKADFAVRVNGDSMEPYLPDGSIQLGVKGTPRDGEVAALMVDGAFYVKQVCIDAVGNLYLFSLNRDRKDADLTVWASAGSTVSCFGTIVMNERIPLPLN